MPAPERTIARNDNTAQIVTRTAEIEAWFDTDMDAQAFIVKYIGASEQTHVRNCDTAFDMWESLKSFYEFHGEIEIANAIAQLSTLSYHYGGS